MKAMNAWVVTADHTDRERYALDLLPGRWGRSQIKPYLVRLYSVMPLTLKEQLSLLRQRRNRVQLPEIYERFGWEYSLVWESSLLMARYARVLGVRSEEGGRSWVRYKPEPLSGWRPGEKGSGPHRHEGEPTTECEVEKLD